MRARNVLLAILIIIGGMIITAYYRGDFQHWDQIAHSWAQYVNNLMNCFRNITGVAKA